MTSKKITTDSIQNIFNSIASRYDFVNKIISFGRDGSWRNSLVTSCAKPQNKNAILCDIATGTGEVLFTAARMRKDYSVFRGYDISANMLQIASQKLASDRSLCSKNQNIVFAEAPAHQLPVGSDSITAITVAFGVRNFIQRKESFVEFHRVLHDKGTLSILEILPPEKKIKKVIFNLYFSKIMPLLGSLLSQKDAYRYLSQSVNNTLTAPELIQELASVGYTLISHKRWIFGAVNLIVVEKVCA